jgi:hypothetical protein
VLLFFFFYMLVLIAYNWLIPVVSCVESPFHMLHNLGIVIGGGSSVQVGWSS